MVASRTYDTDYGTIPVEKTIGLSDSIEKYSGEYGSEDELLSETLTGLREIVSSLLDGGEYGYSGHASFLNKAITTIEDYLAQKSKKV